MAALDGALFIRPAAILLGAGLRSVARRTDRDLTTTGMELGNQARRLVITRLPTCSASTLSLRSNGLHLTHALPVLVSALCAS